MKRLLPFLILFICSQAEAKIFIKPFDATGVKASRDITLACDDDAILKYDTATSSWACATDSTGVGGGTAALEDYLIDVSAGGGVSVDTTEVSHDQTFGSGTLGETKWNQRLSGGVTSVTWKNGRTNFSGDLSASGDMYVLGDDIFMSNGSNLRASVDVVVAKSHDAVTLAGENYLTLSGQQITANSVNLSGTHATGTLAAGRFPALTGEVTTTAGSLATTISTNAVSGDDVATQGVSTDKFEAVNKPSDGYLMRYNATALKGEWVPCSTITGSAGLCDGNDASGGGGSSAVEDYLIDISAGSGVSVDITEVSKDMTFSDGTLSALKQNFRLSGGTQSLTIRPSNWDFSNNLNVSGDLTVTGGDITLGTSSIFSGGDTASLNNIDAVDATTETTFESALDIAGDVSSTGMGSTVIGTATVSGDKVATQGVSTDKFEASNKPTDGQVFSYKQNSLKGKWIGPISKSIGITIDGGGSAITTGVKGYIEVPYGCLITRQTTLLDQSGSIKIDIWKDTYANYPPTDADTITGGGEPTISSATSSQDQVLAKWTKTITSGDVLGFNVDSITTATRAHIILKCDI